MNRWGGRLGWLVAAVAVVAALILWREHRQDRADLRGAARRGEVTVSLQVQGPDSAQVTVTRTGTGRGRLDFVLPAGVVIRSADGASQALMTAVPVAVRIAGGSAATQVSVETYCLEPLKPSPTIETPVVFAQDAADSGDLRGDDASKLVQCLRPDFATHGERQLAVWLVAQGYLDKPYDEVREKVDSSLRSELAAGMQRKLATDFPAEFRKRAPNVSDQEIQAQLARFTPERIAERVGAKADAMTDSFLKGFLAARPLLERCGYKPETLAFFGPRPSG